LAGGASAPANADAHPPHAGSLAHAHSLAGAAAQGFASRAMLQGRRPHLCIHTHARTLSHTQTHTHTHTFPHAPLPYTRANNRPQPRKTLKRAHPCQHAVTLACKHCDSHTRRRTHIQLTHSIAPSVRCSVTHSLTRAHDRTQASAPPSPPALYAPAAASCSSSGLCVRLAVPTPTPTLADGTAPCTCAL
jgi:hypothetical protein